MEGLGLWLFSPGAWRAAARFEPGASAYQKASGPPGALSIPSQISGPSDSDGPENNLVFKEPSFWLV